jgi:nicotinamidase-related amidase
MKSALLVIDAQKVYTTKGSELACKDATKTVERINSLITAFEKARKPIVLIRHVHRRDGSDLGRMFDFSGEAEDDFNFKEGDEEVEYDARLKRPRGGAATELTKNRYSAFAGTGLEQSLRQHGVTRVVICGFMTNFCCESSARYAHDADFHVDLIPDATGTPGTENMSEKELRKSVSESIAGGIGRVLSTKQFLKMWDRQ